MKERLSVTVEENLVKRLDRVRGRVPRSPLVEAALADYVSRVEGLLAEVKERREEIPEGEVQEGIPGVDYDPITGLRFRSDGKLDVPDESREGQEGTPGIDFDPVTGARFDHHGKLRPEGRRDVVED